MRTLAKETIEILREVWSLLRLKLSWVIIFLLTIITMAIVLVPYDKIWLALITQKETPFLETLADGFTLWGDYHTGSLGIGALLLILGALFRNTRLRRVALASILAASLSGLTVNLARGVIGRPRPMAKMPDGLYGPSLKFKMQSLPSGHSATAFASATTLLVTIPILGMPAVAAAFAVAWSRLYLHHHHPTDVFLGGIVGILIGLFFAIAARRTSTKTKNRQFKKLA
ncbi:MAG: phosphatase PAP2 family protein [Deltaproteobacteria bacterium]|nr:phosphatase PAP2 family protein [Deltaproteobacteria bacterium]